jgi:retinol dehydrogenase-12
MARPAALRAPSSVAALRRSAARAPRTLAAAPRALANAENAGKLVLITGANTGLGKRAALELSRDFGFTVVAACRSLARGEAAAKDVAAAGGAMDVLELDLGSFASVAAFADAFKAKYGRCDVLLNNAGIMAPPSRQLTVDGHEVQLQVNHLGHFLLTDLLLDTLLAAPAARIINVASTAHLFGSINFANLQSEGFFGYPALGWSAYGQSKLANVLFSYELNRRLRRAGADHVDVNAVHPGVVDTGACGAQAVLS